MCRNLHVFILSLWRSLCGGVSVQEVALDSSEQQLLHHDVGNTHNSQRSSSDGSGRQGRQVVIVMRHGHRQDEQDHYWHHTAERPWDPPLSKLGRQQAAEAGEKLAEMLDIDYVVSSPFYRCLQTSAEIVSKLKLPQGRWVVDWALSEILEPRVLFSGRPDSIEHVGGRGLDTWMWDGKSLEVALQDFIEEEATRSEVPIQPQPRMSWLPTYPENLERGLKRYSRAIREVAKAYQGHNVLIVTHGECIRQAVVLGVPQAEVFEVRHTGYVALTRDGGSKRWRCASKTGQTGVMWVDT